MHPPAPHTPDDTQHTAPVTYHLHQPQNHHHQPHQPPIPWLAIGAYATAALGLAFAIIAIFLFLSYRDTTTAQIRQLSRALNAARTQDASSYSSLSGQTRSISNQLSQLNGLDIYNQICTQDFTGPHGPAIYTLPCAQQKNG